MIKKPYKGTKTSSKAPKQAMPEQDTPLFPMRINKYLAMKGYATRRGADELIAKKVVTINGRSAVLGDKVNETDEVEVRKSKKPENYVYFAGNKPRGIPTLDTRKGMKGFANALPANVANIPGGLFPVGSLDREASGLIIFTNDRRIIDRLENPKHAHPKVYLVETVSPLRANFKEKLEAGVVTADGTKVGSRVTIKDQKTCLISTIDNGNHLREVCSMFGAEVKNMIRTGILNLTIGSTAPGSFRKIEGEELAEFLKRLGL